MPRPHTPILSRRRIRRAALDLVDRTGLDGLSMRKLAAELDVRAASLYSHYATKDELLSDIANKLVEQRVDVTGFDAGWREGLAGLARSYRAALAAHPNMVPFLARGSGHRDASLRIAGAVHGALIGGGWPPRHATMIGAATKYLVLGAAIDAFSGGFSDDAQAYVDRYPDLGHAHLLREHAAQIDNDSFEFALSAFLAGLDTMRAAVMTQP